MKQIQMNCSSVLYIYQNKAILRYKNKYYEFVTDALKNGTIVNSDEFISVYNHFLKENHLFKLGFHKNIKLVLDELLSQNDIEVFINIFKELNYQKVFVVKEIDLININDNDSYLINTSHLKLYYVNDFKEVVFILLDYLDDTEIKYILNRRIKNNLMIFNINKNYDYKNYYYLPDDDIYFLKKLV